MKHVIKFSALCFLFFQAQMQACLPEHRRSFFGFGCAKQNIQEAISSSTNTVLPTTQTARTTVKQTTDNQNDVAQASVLMNSPLTELADILESTSDITQLIQKIVIIAGRKPGVFSFPSAQINEMNQGRNAFVSFLKTYKTQHFVTNVSKKYRTLLQEHDELVSRGIHLLQELYIEIPYMREWVQSNERHHYKVKDKEKFQSRISLYDEYNELTKFSSAGTVIRKLDSFYRHRDLDCQVQKLLSLQHEMYKDFDCGNYEEGNKKHKQQEEFVCVLQERFCEKARSLVDSKQRIEEDKIDDDDLVLQEDCTRLCKNKEKRRALRQQICEKARSLGDSQEVAGTGNRSVFIKQQDPMQSYRCTFDCNIDEIFNRYCMGCRLYNNKKNNLQQHGLYADNQFYKQASLSAVYDFAYMPTREAEEYCYTQHGLKNGLNRYSFSAQCIAPAIMSGKIKIKN